MKPLGLVSWRALIGESDRDLKASPVAYYREIEHVAHSDFGDRAQEVGEAADALSVNADYQVVRLAKMSMLHQPHRGKGRREHHAGAHHGCAKQRMAQS